LFLYEYLDYSDASRKTYNENRCLNITVTPETNRNVPKFKELIWLNISSLFLQLHIYITILMTVIWFWQIWFTVCLFSKFHESSPNTFYVILYTNRHTEKVKEKVKTVPRQKWRQ